MTAVQPRLRMFAGPNGSGKSTLKEVLDPDWLGIYVNADDIEADIRRHGFLALGDFGVEATEDELHAFFADSALLRKSDLLEAALKIRLQDGRVVFGAVEVNSYFS